MPRKMKTYTLGNHGTIGPVIRDALDLPSHIFHAKILAVAATKTAAAHLLDAHGCGMHSPRDPEFRVASGNIVDALDAAGLLNEPAVYALDTPGLLNEPAVHATRTMPRPGEWVVRVLPGGVPVRVGRLMAADGYGRVFEAVDQ